MPSLQQLTLALAFQEHLRQRFVTLSKQTLLCRSYCPWRKKRYKTTFTGIEPVNRSDGGDSVVAWVVVVIDSISSCNSGSSVTGDTHKAWSGNQNHDHKIVSLPS